MGNYRRKKHMLNNYSISRNSLPKIFSIVALISLIVLAVIYFKLPPRLFTIHAFFLLPSFLVLGYDKSQSRTLSQSVFLANLAGIFYKMPSFVQVIYYSKLHNVALLSLIEIDDLLVIYSFSLLGASLAFFVPPIFFTIQLERLKNRRGRLLKRIEKLNSKWHLAD